MADQTPRDPLGDRLRSTFRAEHADIERRHLAAGGAPAGSRSLKWIPFAVAAAVIAIAGFAFASTRSNDQAVDLDVAAQTPDGIPDTTTPSNEPAQPTEATLQPAQPQNHVDNGPDYQSGLNLCGADFALGPRVVFAQSQASVPALRAPATLGDSGDGGVVRMVNDGVVVELVGGCALSETADGPIAWFEIASDAAEATEWIRSDYLATVAIDAPPSPVPTANTCESSVPLVPHFVWNIAEDDPDDGLLAHVEPGVATAITRVIGRNGVVVPTGGCALTLNGSPWYELRTAQGSVEWVNARYLEPTQPACLVSSQLAAADPRDVDLEPFFHTVRQGDRLGLIATLYNVSIETIVQANPDKDPNLIIAGDRWRIPGAPTVQTATRGPANGWATQDDAVTAFVASADEDRFDPLLPLVGASYSWYLTDVVVEGPCYQDNGPIGPICLSGDVFLSDLNDSGRSFDTDEPITAWTTGRVVAPALAPGPTELVEVEIIGALNERLVGFVDDSLTAVVPGHCVGLAAMDSFDAQPCAAEGAPIADPLRMPSEDPPWAAGDPTSTADHVHDMRTETNEICTRIVVTFGEQANGDGTDRAAALLPPVIVDQGDNYVRISPQDWAMETAFRHPDRIDYPGGVGIVAQYPGFNFGVELMHHDRQAFIRFRDNPARIVVDLTPADPADTISNGPFGEQFILREPIQPNPFDQGIPADRNIIVAGFGRPFEASGLYRIWSVPDDVDAEAFLLDPPEPLIEDFFPTSGWAQAWGSFIVDLPDLEPGSYIAVFGELPPTDEIGFYGTGQLFRVADAPTSEPGSWPEAVLLPNVQLPPE